MSSFIKTIIGSLIKSMLQGSTSNNSLFNETYNNVVKSITLLIVIGTLLASTVLLFCFGIGYYLFNQGFSVYEILAMIIIGKILFISLATLYLRDNIQKVKHLGDEEGSKNDSESSQYHIVESFVKGFNYKQTQA